MYKNIHTKLNTDLAKLGFFFFFFLFFIFIFYF